VRYQTRLCRDSPPRPGVRQGWLQLRVKVTVLFILYLQKKKAPVWL